MVLGATDSVKRKQRSLSYSPIGAVANELYSLKVALQWFPTRRGAGCTALNHANPNERERERGRGKKITAAVLLLEKFFHINESSIHHLNSIESRIICMLCQMAFNISLVHMPQPSSPSPTTVNPVTDTIQLCFINWSIFYACMQHKALEKNDLKNKKTATTTPPHSERLKAGILGTC